MQYISNYSSPLGEITLVSNGESLIGLCFNNQKYFANIISKSYKEKSLSIFDTTKKWLDIYFSGKSPSFTPKICLNSTQFRLIVWNIIMQIPYGKVVTYKDIAQQIVKQKHIYRMSSQAVGGAVGHNPISIIIPCHRVIGSDGNLIGYAGGIDKKLSLLKLEKANMKEKNKKAIKNYRFIIEEKQK